MRECVSPSLTGPYGFDVHRFVAGIVDALNAEIALGTVANVHDAVQWLSYTYLFVRMKKSPFQYGKTFLVGAVDV